MNPVKEIANIAYCNRMADGDGTIKSVARAVVLYVESVFAPLLCRVFGHQYESYADAESGYEEVACLRCGWEFHCYH